jgi:glucokinase
MSDRPSLLADIGGTNARFGLILNGETPATRVLACADFASPAAAAAAFLADIPESLRPRRAAFALAGPVLGDEVTMVNRGWTFSLSAMQRELGLERLVAVNDFTAVALAAPRLTAADVMPVGGGQAVAGAPVAVLGPGSGLGVSGLLPRPGGGWVALSGEGGHATMGAYDDREAAVLAALRREYGHVSAERVLSGPGLAALYRGLAAADGEPLARRPTAAEISEAALSETDPRAVEAVEMFCALLGTAAGNLALTLGAVGGVLIAGGIVPRLGARFVASKFRGRFEEKGRLSAYLANIPTAVVTHPLPAFLGLQEALGS